MWSPDRDHNEIMESGLWTRVLTQSTVCAALMGTFIYLVVMGLRCSIVAHRLSSWGMWDLSSQTRDWTRVPYIARWIL